MKALAPFALIVAVMAAACSPITTPSTTTPTATQATETFSGTVPVGGSDAHNFSVSAAGTVTVTLTAASPPDSIVMGVGFGTPSGSSCALLPGGSVNTAAGTTPQMSGILTPGALCVKVSALDGQTSVVSYTVTVVHP